MDILLSEQGMSIFLKHILCTEDKGSVSHVSGSGVLVVPAPRRQ